MPIETKELIAQAVRRLLTEQHKKKLTVKDIAEECQITRQAFYYHFEDIPAVFRWVLEQNSERLLQEALSFEDSEQGLKYLFRVAINAAPQIKQGMETNYRAELKKILFECCYHFFERVTERENLYPNCSRSDAKLFLRYHSHAVIGLLQEWTDDDTKNLDDIVHKLHRLMSGEISVRLMP